jgi:hypothetical protein
MRAIIYDSEFEAIDNWLKLEQLVEHLHEKGTNKYTYVSENILFLQPLEKYEPIVSEWLKGKNTIDYEPPIITDENNT